MTGLIKSELRKVRTTNVWWIMLLALVGFTALALLTNIVQGAYALDHPDQANGDTGLTPDAQARANLVLNARFIASNVYTSGQYIGLLIATVMGALIVTNEFQHQTATATFLVTPNRLRVVAAKLVAALAWGAVYAVVTTILSLPVGAIWLASRGLPSFLADGGVLKAIALNLLAFGIWAVFGLGLGTLLKNQIATIVVILVVYLVANTIVRAVLMVLSQHFHEDWIGNLQYALPSVESGVMTSAVPAPGGPAWWGAALMLTAYGSVAAGIGAVIIRRRDIA
jgi:ABC-2 type transport system permease protein